jgi:predicted membrane protein
MMFDLSLSCLSDFSFVLLLSCLLVVRSCVSCFPALFSRACWSFVFRLLFCVFGLLFFRFLICYAGCDMCVVKNEKRKKNNGSVRRRDRVVPNWCWCFGGRLSCGNVV